MIDVCDRVGSHRTACVAKKRPGEESRRDIALKASHVVLKATNRRLAGEESGSRPSACGGSRSHLSVFEEASHPDCDPLVALAR
jgi:hypothetical protein